MIERCLVCSVLFDYNRTLQIGSYQAISTTTRFFSAAQTFNLTITYAVLFHTTTDEDLKVTQIIPHKILRNSADVARNFSLAQGLCDLFRFPNRGRTQSCLHKAMLKWAALFVVVHQEAQFALSVFLTVLERGVDCELVAFYVTVKSSR